jgi:Predicted transcriptional regulator
MNGKILAAETDEIEHIARALDSELRRRILALLGNRQMNINQLAEELGIPQSTCTVNVLILEKAKLIHTEQVAASKGSQKICSAPYDEIILSLRPREMAGDDKSIVIEMPVGLYTDFKVSAPCGLLNSGGIISYFDIVDSFLNPKRSSAGLIWFTRGYLEYRFPKEGMFSTDKIEAIALSAEICSEFPGFNNNWPSDISVWINGVDIGTWTCPGDMGGERGRNTPEWWDLTNSQFGFLKSWRITRQGCFVDGVRSGDATIADLNIEKSDFFAVRIGVKDDAEYQGGLNIFGKEFGNYEQDIIFKIELADA